MIDPLERFQAEHREALAVLDRLETAAHGLRGRGAPVAHLAIAREACRFLCSAVREHNKNEEVALFPLLGDDAPTAVFIEEHVRLRALEQALERAVASRDHGRTAAAALELVDLLRSHIAREDEVLFPMARTLLGRDGLAALAAKLDAP